MANIRLIPRLDIKGKYLIKSVQLEGVRKVGDPHEFARRYYLQGADELLYMDAVASLYDRNYLTEIVRETVQDVFIPITVGGGIRSLDDVRKILLSGADKVAVNTAAIRDPSLIDQIARQFGSQCMVLSIEAKRVTANRWEAYTDNGREKSGRDVISWAREAADRGAGEILLTSVDREGTRRGFDLELVASVTQAVRIPVIASGGMGQMEHLAAVVQGAGASAIAMADILHYGRASLPEIRDAASRIGIPTRKVAA